MNKFSLLNKIKLKKIKLTKKRLLALFALMLATVLIMKHYSAGDMPQRDAVTVQAEAVKETAIPLEVAAIGSLVASRSVEITPETAGHIEKIMFQDGTYVEAGAPLIKLDEETYRAQYDSAKAKLMFSENKFKRMQLLAKKNFVSQQTMDELDADLKEKRADANESRVMLDRMLLTAPFAGMVSKSKVNPGNYVTVGQSLLTLTDTRHLRVEYNVPEKYLPLLKLGQTVSMRADAYRDKIFTGKVAYIAPTINVENRSIAIYAEVPNEDDALKAGMFVNVTQSLGNEDHALMIPSRSLMPILEGQQVYRVVNGKAETVKVVIGKRTENLVQITQGLSAGDMIITDGQHKVQPGMPVKLKS